MFVSCVVCCVLCVVRCVVCRVLPAAGGETGEGRRAGGRLESRPSQSAPGRRLRELRDSPRVAEDEAWLPYGVNEMDAQDGLIWVYGLGGDGAMAFTGFGIETITGIIDDLEQNPITLVRILRR